MGILSTIKDAIWGTADLTPTPNHDPEEDAYLGTEQAGTGFTPEVETQPDAAAIATPASTSIDDLPRSEPPPDNKRRPGGNNDGMTQAIAGGGHRFVVRSIAVVTYKRFHTGTV